MHIGAGLIVIIDPVIDVDRIPSHALNNSYCESMHGGLCGNLPKLLAHEVSRISFPEIDRFMSLQWVELSAKQASDIRRFGREARPWEPSFLADSSAKAHTALNCADTLCEYPRLGLRVLIILTPHRLAAALRSNAVLGDGFRALAIRISRARREGGAIRHKLPLRDHKSLGYLQLATVGQL
ncbi:hypothetical protein QAD02_020223 [Eretmocerus hayati]|uniref:Uncharacterized protein n=1 Tax=Eretmocerus hayati TaxID=131215 RepID=A0ACC2PNQ3_9HYME|nr:hypothetical protein QAD02_020223 [Eretmocerus hayati]